MQLTWAWRRFDDLGVDNVYDMACACRPDADAALAEMAEDYIAQRYQHAPGRAPAPSHVSAVFSEALQRRFGGREAQVLAHPQRRLHVFTSRGKGLLAREGRIRTPAGYLGAFAANLMHRRALGWLLDRVVFSDVRDSLPLALHEYPTHRVALDEANLAPAILASCSIPFWLDAVHDIAGAPRGAYWDGGITDYHMPVGLPGLTMKKALILGSSSFLISASVNWNRFSCGAAMFTTLRS